MGKSGNSIRRCKLRGQAAAETKNLLPTRIFNLTVFQLFLKNLYFSLNYYIYYFIYLIVSRIYVIYIEEERKHKCRCAIVLVKNNFNWKKRKFDYYFYYFICVVLLLLLLLLWWKKRNECHRKSRQGFWWIIWGKCGDTCVCVCVYVYVSVYCKEKSF